jgi:inorganic pyrophosphatase
MTAKDNERLIELAGLLFQAHPWHGVSAGSHSPEECLAYVEIVPTDAVKYELNKATGHLMVDRPQRYSNFCPTLYGFIPQTYCAEQIAERCMERTGRKGITGDGDPIDICILTERPFAHGNFLCKVRPIGGLRMIDKDEADDKIIAVLSEDLAFGDVMDIHDVPQTLVDRIRHYFLTYKQSPTEQKPKVEIAETYGRAEAEEVIRRSQVDYRTHFGNPETRLKELRNLLIGLK